MLDSASRVYQVCISHTHHLQDSLLPLHTHTHTHSHTHTHTHTRTHTDTQRLVLTRTLLQKPNVHHPSNFIQSITSYKCICFTHTLSQPSSQQDATRELQKA